MLRYAYVFLTDTKGLCSSLGEKINADFQDKELLPTLKIGRALRVPLLLE